MSLRDGIARQNCLSQMCFIRKNIDVWSIGCILGEILGRKPLFPGPDYIDQLTLIVNTLGTPDDEDIKVVDSLKARKFI